MTKTRHLFRVEVGGFPGLKIETWGTRRKPIPFGSDIYDRSGVDAALLYGEAYAVDGQHVGGDAVVHVVGFGVTDHVVEAVAEDGLQLLVDNGFLRSEERRVGKECRSRSAPHQ